MGRRFGMLMEPNRRSFIPILALASVLIFFSSVNVTFAAVWKFAPRITVSETYDDNVRLADESQKKADYITQFNPGFSLEGKGRYSELLVDYTMQNIFYKNNDKSNDTYHKLYASSNTEVFRDHLFLDASANYSQRTINFEKTSSTDNAGISDNRSDVVSYTLSPYFINNFGQSSKLLLRHTYTKIDNISDELSAADNITNTSYIELKSGPSFKRFSWQLSHQKQLVDYNQRPDVESLNSQALFNYQFMPKVYFVGVIGYEKYNYAVIEGQEDPEGSYWEAGLGWTPSPRTRLEIKQGEHYYGASKSLLFNHRTRQSSWLIKYSEEVNTTSRIDVQETAASDVSFVNVAVVSLNKVLSATISKTTAKSEFALNIANSRRIYLEQSGEERNTSVLASWIWRVASRTSVKFQESLTARGFSTSDREIKTRKHLMSIDYNITRSALAYFSYENTVQKSNIEGNLYNRNMYTLGISVRF